MIPILRSTLLWAAVACFLYYSGSLDELDKKIRIAMSAFAGAGIVVVAVFLWNLFFAPVWIDKEQEDKIVVLEKHINDAKITEGKTAGLMKIRGQLIDDIFAPPISDYELEAKNKLFKDIHAGAIQYVKTNGYKVRDIGLLEHLGEIAESDSPKAHLKNMAKKVTEVILEITGNDDGQKEGSSR